MWGIVRRLIHLVVHPCFPSCRGEAFARRLGHPAAAVALAIGVDVNKPPAGPVLAAVHWGHFPVKAGEGVAHRRRIAPEVYARRVEVAAAAVIDVPELVGLALRRANVPL